MAYKLILFNNMTKAEVNLENLDDLQDSRLFYHFNLTLPSGVTDGEYSYTLVDEDDTVKATGLVQIGQFKHEANQYTAQTPDNKYIVYGE